MSGDASRVHGPTPDLWDEAYAAGLDEPGLLLYRSNLLGSDLRIANFGGSNTSAQVEAAFAEAALAYGGLDIVVSNAGIASAAAIEDTSLALWNRNIDILETGYFLAARAAFRVMKRQGIGGSIVFIVSKNGLAASPGAAAYCAAKALELHLARCLALEGAPLGIRVNCVNPDAAPRGSKTWRGEWRDQRAQSNKVTVDELEEVYPEDVAEAAYFLASDAASKSTGNIVNVDAGNAVSFSR